MRERKREEENESEKENEREREWEWEREREWERKRNFNWQTNGKKKWMRGINGLLLFMSQSNNSSCESNKLSQHIFRWNCVTNDKSIKQNEVYFI